MDNLKTGVLKPDIYDPKLNRTYAEMGNHFGCLLDPARAGKPKDKPRVERPMPQAVVADLTERVVASSRSTTHAPELLAVTACPVDRGCRVARIRSRRIRSEREFPDPGTLCAIRRAARTPLVVTPMQAVTASPRRASRSIPPRHPFLAPQTRRAHA
jgi:hypothetical protein